MRHTVTRETVRRHRERQAAEPYLCGELFADDEEFPPEPPPQQVRDVIRDLADYQTQPEDPR